MDNQSLLISDVDGTLLGDTAALQQFADWVGANRDLLKLVYNSGRFFSSIGESIKQTLLPEPDAIIGGVGTQIREWPSGNPIGDWLSQPEGWWPLSITSTLAEFSGLEMQPSEFLSSYKLSYYLNDAPPEKIRKIEQALADAGCLVDVVYSSQRDLDILPQGINKGSASAWLADHWGFSHNRVMVSGDSGNDLAMFQNGFCGIVVGNAHNELRELASDRIFHARNEYAVGVLEGIEHWRGLQN